MGNGISCEKIILFLNSDGAVAVKVVIRNRVVVRVVRSPEVIRSSIL